MTATLHATWKWDGAVSATFTLGDDGRVLRRFDGETAVTHEGSVPAPYDEAALRRWLFLREYVLTPPEGSETR